ncbi:MAG: helix-turn-helix domain-containing protein [Blastochloris sp.]|nr:helix-turn-helix domain-containing protein [Blastochloris sp.]
MSQRTYDREPVLDATEYDLNLDIVQATIVSGHNLNRFHGSHDPWEYLRRFSGILDHDGRRYPTVAGLLAFADEPDRWLPGSGIDIARYQHNPSSTGHHGATMLPGPTSARIEQIRGPIFHVIDRAVEVLQDACTISVYDGPRIVNTLDTPLNVLRELTTNGVVHRDLRLDGAQVRVQIFPGFIEWISPGRLPPEVFPDEIPLSLDLLLTAQYARNPTLAQFLFHRGYIEKFGMGLDDVVAALREIRRGIPEFHNDKHSFRVRVTRPTVGKTYDLSTKEGSKRAILAMFDERPYWRQNEIAQRLGIPRSSLQRYLRELLAERQLAATGATNQRIYHRWSAAAHDSQQLL